MSQCVCRSLIHSLCPPVSDFVDWVCCPSYGGDGHGHCHCVSGEPLICLQNVSVWPPTVSEKSLLLCEESTCKSSSRWLWLSTEYLFQYCRGRTVLSLPRLLALCAAGSWLLLSSRRETGSPHHDQGRVPKHRGSPCGRIKMKVCLSLCAASRTVPAVFGRPALHSSVPLQWGVGPGCRRSCGEHGTWSCAGCCASQHHWLWVRAHTPIQTHCSLLFQTLYCLNWHLKLVMVIFSDDLEFPRSWLIPVIRDHVKNTHLGFFTSYFLPLASTLKQRGNLSVRFSSWDLGTEMVDLLSFCVLTVKSLLFCSWGVGASRKETWGQSLPDVTATGRRPVVSLL